LLEPLRTRDVYVLGSQKTLWEQIRTIDVSTPMGSGAFNKYRDIYHSYGRTNIY